ncbi:MAG: DUF5723 family protein [Balneolaceae bacterium]
MNNKLMGKWTLIFKSTLTILLCLIPGLSYSQLSLNAENMALGGGGTSYLTGYEALFVNPANLFINEKDQPVQLSLFQGAFIYHSILPGTDNQNRWHQFLNVIKPYDPELNQQIDPDIRELLLQRNFNGENLRRSFSAQTEMNWFGLKWKGEDRNYAIALRTRVGNQFQIGKGVFAEEIDTKIINQSFYQRYQVLHELSFGFSEAFTFLNGINPKLSTFIIGIAPKIVLPGAGLNVNFNNNYSFDSAEFFWENNPEYHQITSGSFSNSEMNPFHNLFNNEERPVLINESFKNHLKPSGWGVGLDVGLTYLITFGNELYIPGSDNLIANQSIRFSLSFTDIGATYINKDPIEYHSDLESSLSNRPGPVSELIFSGSPNEHYNFLTEFSTQPIFNSGTGSTDNFLMMLPSSVQTGALIQYHWFKFMGDASYTMSDNAFKPAGLISYLGTEIRPLPYLPLRAGTRFGKELPVVFSFGTGIETSYFDLNAAIMFRGGSGDDSLISNEVVGASVIGLTIFL